MSEANMTLTDFLDGQILTRYRKMGWDFKLDEWVNKNDERQADLAFKSPRMKKFEVSYSGPMAERTLLDEEAWAVAREYMDKNLCFQAEFKQKFLDFFRQNKQVNPESVVPVIEFKIKSVK